MPHSTQSGVSSERPILIIGAGLSGLTTARVLQNHGIPNIVFEASGPERSQGFSISLRPWGYTALLEALGSLPLRSLTRKVAPDRFTGGSGWVDQTMRNNANGEILINPDPTKMEPIVRANRNALRQWIADCGDDELDIRYGHKLQRLSGTFGNMTAEFESGAKYNGAIIIGADGVHSAVRGQVLPHILPEVVPVVVYHGEFKLSHEEFDRLMRPHIGNSNILAGVGDGFNTPITVCDVNKDGVSLDWSYSRSSTGEGDPLYRPNLSTEAAKQIPQALLDELASRNLAAPWSEILSPESVIMHHVFSWVSRCVGMTREEVEKGSAHGVCFVGDSWHGMPIFGGEGGNHAILDGVELAEAILKADGDLETATKSFYAGSFKRCQDAVKRSRQRFFVLHRPMTQWLEIAAKMAHSE